jgi:MFS transporter, DHA1 family, solute carrier family 18 (vesicular amine transporter), member 1/2
MSPPGEHRALLLLVTAAIGMDVLVYSMLIPLLPAYAQAFGLGQIELGVLLAAYAVGLFLVTPAAGWLCDRRGRRGPFLIGLVGVMLATLLFALAESYRDLLLARLLQGAASGATWTAGLALVSAHFPPQRRGSAMGTAMSGNAFGMLLGPLFGGIAGQHLGLQLPFVLAAALALLLVLMGWRLRHRLSAAAGPAAGGQLALARDAQIRVLAAALLTVAAVITLIEPTLPLHLAERFDAGAGTIGALFAALMLGHPVCTPLAGRCSDRFGSAFSVRLGGIVMALTLPLLVLPTDLVTQTLCFIAFGMGTAFALIPLLPLLALLAERHGTGAYARAFALFNVVYAAGMIAGPMLGSITTTWVGLPMTLTGAAVLVVLLLWRLPSAQAAR